jgi:hypothetical protein
VKLWFLNFHNLQYARFLQTGGTRNDVALKPAVQLVFSPSQGQQLLSDTMHYPCSGGPGRKIMHYFLMKLSDLASGIHSSWQLQVSSAGMLTVHFI